MFGRERLSGINIWPEGDRWRWEIVHFSAGGTRTVARGTEATEVDARRSAQWRALRGDLWLIVAGATAVVGLLVWLLK